MNAFTIARRDIAAYLHSYAAYVIIAFMLFLQGIFFNAWALGSTSALYSHEVLQQFFYFDGGFAIAAAVLFTMRSIAEERATGTDVLLSTSTFSDHDIVLGKYLACMGMVTLLTALTFYMPALIFVNGKVSIAHVAVGYLGVLSIASATTAIGIFGSSLFKSQIGAGIFSGTIVLTGILMWILSDITDPPFTDLVSYMAIWNKHFTPFQLGRLATSSLVYYASVTGLFLFLATRVMEGRRWE
jgi:ABC-2 type transport system permease protein